MTIYGTCGNRTVTTLSDLLATLRSCRMGDFAEFWISCAQFPVLTIHVNRDLAYLHFFEDESHPGFQAVGDAGPGDAVFFKQAGGQDFSMPRTVIVSAERAYQAAAEFFTNSHLPNCIQWKELRHKAE